MSDRTAEQLSYDEIVELIVDADDAEKAWDDEKIVLALRELRQRREDERVANTLASVEVRPSKTSNACREQFDMWAENLCLCMDELFMSSNGVPENPFENNDTKQFYAAWLAAWEASEALNKRPAVETEAGPHCRTCICPEAAYSAQKATEASIPHNACKTPSDCRREQICFDPWNCASEKTSPHPDDCGPRATTYKDGQPQTQCLGCGDPVPDYDGQRSVTDSIDIEPSEVALNQGPRHADGVGSNPDERALDRQSLDVSGCASCEMGIIVDADGWHPDPYGGRRQKCTASPRKALPPCTCTNEEIADCRTPCADDELV